LESVLRERLNAVEVGDHFRDRGLEAHHFRWRQDQSFVFAGCTNVGEFLLAADVDVEVVGARVLADQHAFVDLGGRLDEDRGQYLGKFHPRFSAKQECASKFTEAEG